jgi:hypothetical protein
MEREANEAVESVVGERRREVNENIDKMKCEIQMVQKDTKQDNEGSNTSVKNQIDEQVMCHELA